MTDLRGNRRWTREEALAALSLYCQVPFGKLHYRNPDIIRLASAIGRTPSSIALKLVNFASLDPEHRRRGVHGMSNCSRLDCEIWSEFYGKWEILADAGYLRFTLDAFEMNDEVSTEVTATTKLRRGQQFFRNAVMAAYGSRCCITGIESGELIRASHIVPWASNSDTRLDPSNGLLLNALHDAAFDRGLISFDEAEKLLLSPKLRSDMPASEYQRFFERYAGVALTSPERFAPRGEYLIIIDRMCLSRSNQIVRSRSWMIFLSDCHATMLDNCWKG